MSNLQGKTAIITGASSGIGLGIARKLSQNGVNVVLAARTIEKLTEIADEINKANKGKALAVQTDISKQEDVKGLVNKAKETFNEIDILVNNAGQMLSAPVRSGKVSEWETMIDVNIKGVLYSIDAVLPSLVERKTGHLINVASVSGFEVTKHSTVYSATKYAVRAISTGLEKELARTGVRVTNISPGMVDTRLAEGRGSSDRNKLTTIDIANAVIYALTQPDYVNVNEITVRPV